MEGIVQEAIELQKDSLAFNSESRDLGQEDMEFELGGEHCWDPEIWNQRGERPRVTINTVSNRKHRLANDLRDLNPEIQITCDDDEYEEQADVRNEIMRAIQRNSCAEPIYDSCFNQGLSSGFSFMRVLKEYEAPDSFEQKISIRWIPNNFGVHYDYLHKNPGYIDMRWGLIEGEFRKEEYRKKFPNATSELNFPTSAFESPVNDKMIRTAEYYRINEIPKKLLMLADGMGHIIKGFADDQKIKMAMEQEIDGQSVYTVVRERQSYRPQLEYYVLNGAEILQETKDALGNYIPIIPYEGRVLWIKGKKYLVSFIRNLKEPAQLKNYGKSLEVELVALQPLNVWKAAQEGVEDYMDFYTSAHKKRWPIMLWKHKDDAGLPIPEPKREQYQGTANQLGTLFQQYDKDLDDTSGQYPENLGGPSQLRSGVAIDLKQSQGNHNNFDFIDNFTTRSLNYLGIVCNDLISCLYDDEREIIIEKDGQKKKVLLNQEGGVDMTKGNFGVHVAIRSASDSKRRETNDILLQLMEKVPAMQNVAHIIAKNLDNLNDKQDVVKILKASLPPNVLGMIEADEQAIFVENAQLKQQLEGIQAEYQKAMDLVKSMQIDYEKTMDQQKLRSATEIEKAEIQSATTLVKTQMENQGKLLQNLASAFSDIKTQISDLTSKFRAPETQTGGENENV